MAGTDMGEQLGERAMLTGFLDWYRDVVTHKVGNLTFADATRQLSRTGLSPLGVIKHLGWVECWWFRDAFAGQDVERKHIGNDNSIQFVIEPGDTLESVTEFYRQQIERAREVVDAAPSLGALSVRDHRVFGQVSLRWILIHMIEETARHAGHLDLMREEIDGTTGD